MSPMNSVQSTPSREQFNADRPVQTVDGRPVACSRHARKKRQQERASLGRRLVACGAYLTMTRGLQAPGMPGVATNVQHVILFISPAPNYPRRSRNPASR